MDERKKMFKELVDHGFLLPTTKGATGHSRYVPLVTTESALPCLFPAEVGNLEKEFPEEFDAGKLRRYVSDNPCRARNVKVLADALEAFAQAALPPGRGSRCPDKKAEWNLLMSEREKLIEQEVSAKRLLERLGSIVGAHGNTMKIASKYNMTSPTRSRRYVEGVGAQKLSSRLRLFLLAGVLDFDIKNCMFTLVEQIADRLTILFDNPAAKMPGVKRYNINRGEILKHLNSDRNVAKQICISVFNGGRIPDELKGSEILLQLKDEGRLFRWVSASAQQEMHQALVAEGEKDCPEAPLLTKPTMLHPIRFFKGGLNFGLEVQDFIF